MNLLCCNVYVIFMKRKRKRASHLRASVRHNFNGKQMHTCKYLLGNKIPYFWVLPVWAENCTFA